MRLALVFSGFFTVFLIIGFYRGQEAVRKDDYLLYALLGQVVVSENGAELLYQCGKTTLASHHLDGGKLTEHDFELLVYEENKQPVPLDTQTLISLLGGASGAWGIKDVITFYQKGEKKSNAVKTLIAAIAGGLSGYISGFGLGARRPLECRDPKIIALLRDPQRRKALEWNVFAREFKDIDGMTASIPDEELRRKLRNRMRLILGEVEKRQADISSADLLGLRRISQEANPPLGSSSWREPDPAERRRHMLFVVLPNTGLTVYCMVVIWVASKATWAGVSYLRKRSAHNPAAAAGRRPSRRFGRRR